MFRKYVQLRPLDTSVHSLHPDRIQGSYEFRAFVYKGEIVGLGPYWWQDESYRLSQTDERTVKSLVHSAASMLAAPFVVIDVAQTIAGQWIVIESNDAQESGHAGISPLELWSNIVAREQAIVALGACSHAVSLAQYENKTPLVISRPSPRALARGIMGRR